MTRLDTVLHLPSRSDAQVRGVVWPWVCGRLVGDYAGMQEGARLRPVRVRVRVRTLREVVVKSLGVVLRSGTSLAGKM